MKTLRQQLEEGSDQADLTPMLDCVFLLLLFFVVASTFSESTHLFEVTLPSASHASVKPMEEVIELGIDREGRFTVGGTAVPEEQLYDHLKGVVEESGRRTLILQGDRECPYEKVVFAMDLAQALRLSGVSMAVQGPGA